MFILLFTIITYLHPLNHENLFKVPQLAENFTNSSVQQRDFAELRANVQNIPRVREEHLYYFTTNRSVFDERNVRDGVATEITKTPNVLKGEREHLLENIMIKGQPFDVSIKSEMFDPEWDSTTVDGRNRVIPNIIMDMYESLKVDNSIGFVRNIDIIRCLRAVEYQSTTSGVVLKFNVSNVKDKELIIGAELYIYRSPRSSKQASTESSIIRLYQIQSDIKKSPVDAVQSADMHELLGVTYISRYDHGWQKFQVQKSLENCRNETSNPEFILQVINAWGNLVDPKYFGLDVTHSSYSPLLVVYFSGSTFPPTQNQNKQTFSSINEATNTENPTSVRKVQATKLKESCFLQSFSVNFAKEGYNFIVLPKVVALNKCIGTCGTSSGDSTNHRKLLRSLQKPNGAKYGGCCVPKQYSPLTIMFYDYFGNLIIKKYYSMAAQNCECR